ncbi:hypothetical protein [Nocardia mangyaensis]|uniref:hypothetical protein n=1 Tax=Nocardia mangyaensis TaxID=2213200 RepID=UPI002674F765|nr:hypothetical protein [Nocardia mangyaensis]MDO3647181.1 hypothetical protein [Nocardia mangyaensis]
MPSYLHEALLDLFRNELSLAFSLLVDEFGIPANDLVHTRAEPCDFTDIGPKEFRGDLALSTHDARDRPVLGVCVEVQLDAKDVRRWKWPVYLTTLRARLCCPVVLLVVTPSRKVAKWAEQPIELDTFGSVIQPQVLGPDRFPLVTDSGEARRCPERAVLSAMAHGAGPHMDEVLAAFLSGLMKDLVDEALTTAASRRLEELMERTPEYRGRIATKYMAKGREEGRAEGRAETAARAVLTVLTARGLELSAAQRAQLAECTDQVQLDEWLKQAITATSANELFS